MATYTPAQVAQINAQKDARYNAHQDVNTGAPLPGYGATNLQVNNGFTPTTVGASSGAGGTGASTGSGTTGTQIPSAANGWGTGITQTPQQTQADTLAKSTFDDSQNFNPDSILSAQIAKYQSQIDATKALFAQQISAANVAGVAAAGATRASDSRAGLLGSTFGNTDATNQDNNTQKNVNDITGQENAAIAAILSQAQTDATNIINQKQAAKSAGAQTYLSYLGTESATKQANANKTIAALVQSGVTPDKLSTDQVTSLASSLGMSPSDFVATYTGQLAAQAKTDAASKTNQLTLSEGQQAYQKNADGSYSLIASGTPKSNTTTVTAGGRKLLIDKSTGATIADLGDASTTAGASQNLISAINNGTIDSARVNSRTLPFYNDLADAEVNAVGNHADAAGRTKAIQDQTSAVAQQQKVIGVLDSNMPILEATADKVNTLGIPALDAYINGTSKYTGNDPDVVKYISALATLRTEYANMLAKGQAPTESQRQEAAGAIPAGYDGATYSALAAQLRTEGENIIAAGNTVISQLKQPSYSGSGTGSSTSSSSSSSSGFGWNG